MVGFGWVCFGLVVLQWLKWWWFFECLVAAGLILPYYWVVYVLDYIFWVNIILMCCIVEYKMRCRL